MNIKNADKIIIFFSIFPAWLFSANLYLDDRIIFLIPFLFVIIIFFYIFNSKKLKKYQILILSLVIVWGLDQNFLLEKKLIKFNFDFFQNIFGNIYYARLSILVILFLIIFFLTFYYKFLLLTIITPFLIVISLFNYYEIIYQGHRFQNFDFLKNQNVSKKLKQNKLVFIILDEMSGINSSEREVYGTEFKKKILQLSKSSNLNLYPNAFSLSDNTATSVPSLVNLIDTQEEIVINRKINLKKMNNFYFNEYVLQKNTLFDNFSSISAFQNIHLNFCSHENVAKCYQFNPYKKQESFIEGYKYNTLTRFLSIWKIQGSITANILSRIGRELRIADSYLEPQIHKATFDFFLSEISNDIISQNFDLIFAHLLVPHVPYGFDHKCNYDGKLSLRNTILTNKQKIIQHNIESTCVVFYLNKFFSKIKNAPNYSNFEILILSDHGSRISKSDDSSYSSILMYKSIKPKFYVNNLKKSIHSFTKEILINRHVSSQ